LLFLKTENDHNEKYQNNHQQELFFYLLNFLTKKKF